MRFSGITIRMGHIDAPHFRGSDPVFFMVRLCLKTFCFFIFFLTLQRDHTVLKKLELWEFRFFAYKTLHQIHH